MILRRRPPDLVQSTTNVLTVVVLQVLLIVPVVLNTEKSKSRAPFPFFVSIVRNIPLTAYWHAGTLLCRHQFTTSDNA